MKNKIILAVFLLISTIVYSQNKRGIVLVIGNSNYLEGALKNPVNDANDVSSKFRNLGFDVITKVDANLEQLGSSIDDFGAKAARYDVAIFYYSGHGIQYKGENYLIPVNARLRSEVDVRYYCENLNRVLAKLEESNCKLKILMLDACRHNPFERSWNRSGSSKGLSSMDAPMGTIISYATAPGSTAEDGVGQRNSPYTAAFLRLLDKPNYSIVLLYNELCNVVRKSTNNRQNPWSSNSGIDGNFCFNAGYAAPSTGTSSSYESAEVLYKKGNEYYNQGNYTEAEKWYRKSAEQGYKFSMYSLGWCYQYGLGVSKNLSLAKQWYQKAADKGVADAKMKLEEIIKQEPGASDAEVLYKKGNEYYNQGNYTEAEKWYRKSAEQGDEYSMYSLGWCYQYGRGVSKDLSLAKQWYQKAADKGYADAKKQLEEIIKQESEASDAEALYKRGNEYYNQGNYTEAVKYYRQAAEKGNAAAQCDLGYCYETGKGVQQDYAEAVKWNKKSADQGNKYAQSNLALYYSESRGVTRDYNEAVRWARKSADQGYSGGQSLLGDYYYNGQGVAKDYTEAVKWYRKSAEQGDEYSMYSLGWCYQYGRGVSKDLSLAKQWYQKAADKGYADAKKQLEKIINTSGQK